MYGDALLGCPPFIIMVNFRWDINGSLPLRRRDFPPTVAADGGALPANPATFPDGSAMSAGW